LLFLLIVDGSKECKTSQARSVSRIARETVVIGRKKKKNEVGQGDETAEQVLRLRELQVLCLLWLRPMSVYEIRRELSSVFAVNSSFGTLYPLLRSMEANNLVTGVWGLNSENRPKRAYSLTELGRNAAHNGVQKQIALSSKLSSMISIGSSPSGESTTSARENSEVALEGGFESTISAVSRGPYLW
jgi:PadR family transcriptional regulator PadR